MAEDFNIIDTYEQMSYGEAQKRLSARFTDKRFKLPTLDQIKARRAFDEGDHWQEGNGFIGQLPTGEHWEDRETLLKKAFSPEDVISEVLDTHIENVLGDAPIISFDVDAEDNQGEEEEDADLALIKQWFEKRENEKVLADALRAARRETASVLRAFIPAGFIGGDSRISANNLEEALSKIWFRCEPIETGGVLIDEATATEMGLILYTMRIDEQDVQLCECAYIDANGNTQWGTLSMDKTNKGAEVAEPFEMNGKLPIYQLNAKALITESVCQAQRAVNLSGTMLTRNNNLAGSRERLALNAQPPGVWSDETDANGQVTKVFTPSDMATGPGTLNFINGLPVYDEEGARVTGFGNPNVIFTDPVPVDTFLQTSNHWRTVAYSNARMRHLLMADNATASGRSRIEARKEFQASLNESKQIVDAAGKWMIEAALNIAAHFIGRPGMFIKKEIAFDAQISTIELTPEEIQQIRDDYEAGMIDLRTALELRGFDNVDEILERIEDEEKTRKPVIQAARMPTNETTTQNTPPEAGETATGLPNAGGLPISNQAGG